MKPHRAPLTLLLLAAACRPDDPTDSGDTGDTGEAAQTPFRFPFPILERDAISTPAVTVDHDPAVYEGAYQIVCENYAGEPFPYCYDEHKGSDYLLEGGFAAMDAGSATIVAVAPGVVSFTEDGHYDRCHADAATFDVSCDGHEMVSNIVHVDHEGGWQTRYGHMKSGSVAVEVGDEVEAGTPLGLIGSSGRSSAPHLHFQLQDPEGNRVDPYAGERSQPESWWCEQNGLDELPGGCN